VNVSPPEPERPRSASAGASLPDRPRPASDGASLPERPPLAPLGASLHEPRHRAASETLSESSVRVVVPLPTDDSLAAFESERHLSRSRSGSGRRPWNPPPAPTSRRFSWKRAALATVIALAVLQSALIAWWVATESAPWSAATPTSAPVTITSDPVGASVSLDGAERGVTPLTTDVPAGAHTLQVGSGATARTQPLDVRGGVASAVHIVLPSGPAQPARPTTGGLQVTTEPPGATVVIDGQSLGAAPLTADGLSPGTHEVVVTRAGVTVRRSVDVDAGNTASLIISMTGGGIASGWLAIASPVPAQIFENGTLLGSTDTPRILLPVGSHDLEIVNEALGYRERRSVQVVSGRAATIQLGTVNGVVSVNAQPWAEVFIDGQRVGETPIGNLSVPIGNHQLVLRHPQLGERRQTIAVGVNAPLRVGVDLRK